MTTIINQYFEREVSKSVDLQRRLMAETDRETFVNDLVSLGNEKGYPLTVDMVNQWLNDIFKQRREGIVTQEAGEPYFQILPEGSEGDLVAAGACGGLSNFTGTFGHHTWDD